MYFSPFFMLDFSSCYDVSAKEISLPFFQFNLAIYVDCQTASHVPVSRKRQILPNFSLNRCLDLLVIFAFFRLEKNPKVFL